MADYGFRSLNENLDVQIDGTYPNYSVLKTATQFRTGAGAPWAIATMPSVSQRTPPLTTLKPLATPIVLQGYDQIGEPASLTRVIITYPLGKQLTVHYQIFQPGVSKVATYGLLVKNTSGSSVFSSEDKHLNPIGSYEATLGYDNVGASVDITVSNADTNYFSLSPHVENRGLQVPSPSKDITNRGFRRVDASTVRVITWLYNVYPLGGDFGPSWVATFNLLEFRKE